MTDQPAKNDAPDGAPKPAPLPTSGGAWVRHADGALTRQDDPDTGAPAKPRRRKET